MVARTPGGTPATVALTRAGIGFTVHSYAHDPRSHSYGMEAALALGVEADRVFKTLVVSADGSLAVGIIAVSRRLDLKALARELGTAKAVMADQAVAQRATGYVVGGISPIAQLRTHPTVLDTSALDHPSIFVSAGRRGLDLEVSPGDLIAVVSGHVAPIAR